MPSLPFHMMYDLLTNPGKDIMDIFKMIVEEKIKNIGEDKNELFINNLNILN